MNSFLSDIQCYVGFTDADSALLAEFEPFARPHYERISDRFYRSIEEHPSAAASLSGGAEQVEKLKATLCSWMQTGLAGPHDQTYLDSRSRIGRVHVQIDLPQQYMFCAMNLVRCDLREVVEEAYAGDPERRRKISTALDRLLDIELAIMLQSYREDSLAKLSRQERLATLGQLAGNIAHNLRNPLGVIESSLFLLKKRVGEDPRVVRHLDKISTQVNLSGNIITSLLQMARMSSPEHVPIDVEVLFDRAIFAVTIPSNVVVEREIEGTIELRADLRLLSQALANLISNAISACSGKPATLTMRARNDEHHVVLEVLDDGPGFDADVVGRVFEPLVTTRRDGVGLGLAMVKSIAERHGGTAQALNREGLGAVARLRIPHGMGGQEDS